MLQRQAKPYRASACGLGGSNELDASFQPNSGHIYRVLFGSDNPRVEGEIVLVEKIRMSLNPRRVPHPTNHGRRGSFIHDGKFSLVEANQRRVFRTIVVCQPVQGADAVAKLAGSGPARPG